MVRGRTIVALACAASLLSVAVPAAALSAPSTTRTSTAALQTGLLQVLNATRVRYGLVPLRPSAALATAAAQHTREMAADGYFDHSSADGGSFSSRIAHWYGSVGYAYWSVGENLLWKSPDADAADALGLWMHSPEHRANILNPQWRQVGIAAVHVADAGGAYRNLPVTIVTTDFGVRR